MTTMNTTAPLWAPRTNLWKYINLAVGLFVLAFIVTAVSLAGDLPFAISAIVFSAAGVAAVAAYLLPTAVGYSRHHHNIGAIAVVNVFLGWTFVGWVAALAMAASAVQPRQA